MNNIISLTQGRAEILTSDPWKIVREQEGDSLQDYQIVPLGLLPPVPELNNQHIGVCLDPDEEPELLLPWLDQLNLIALFFPDFKDGRAYSQSNLLRTRYGYKNEIRAVGDVLRDQLAIMQHCGFTSFAVREDKSAIDEMKGLEGFEFIYSRSVIQPDPLYRHRKKG